MKYEISEDKIISVMKKYSEQNYPQILRPFNTKNDMGLQWTTTFYMKLGIWIVLETFG